MNHPITHSTIPSLDIMVLIESDPKLTQRQLAKKAGISLGSVNFVLKGLIGKGFVKAGNFRASSNKAAYLYLLTPAGLYEKSRLTEAFVRRKLMEYERLTAEINRLGELGLLPSEGARRVSRQDHSPPLEDRESMSPDIEI